MPGQKGLRSSKETPEPKGSSARGGDSKHTKDWANGEDSKKLKSEAGSNTSQRHRPWMLIADSKCAKLCSRRSEPEEVASSTNSTASNLEDATAAGTDSKHEKLRRSVGLSGLATAGAETASPVRARPRSTNAGPRLARSETSMRKSKRKCRKGNEGVSSQPQLRGGSREPEPASDSTGGTKPSFAALRSTKTNPELVRSDAEGDAPNDTADGTKAARSAQEGTRRDSTKPAVVKLAMRSKSSTRARLRSAKVKPKLAEDGAAVGEPRRAAPKASSNTSVLARLRANKAAPVSEPSSTISKRPRCERPNANRLKPGLAALLNDMKLSRLLRSGAKGVRSRQAKLRNSGNAPDCRRSGAGVDSPARVIPEASKARPVLSRLFGVEAAPSCAKSGADIGAPVRPVPGKSGEVPGRPGL